MSWQALKWALNEQAGGLTRKAVLIALADQASKRGRTYPTVETIASIIEADKKTVRLAIRHLLNAGLILDTGKRTGANGQTRIYQLPITPDTESSLSPDSVQTESSLTTKSGSQFIGESGPSPDPDPCTHKEYHDQGAAKTSGNSIPNTSPNSSDSSSESHQDQNQPARNHIKWPEFTAYCDSKHGTPTEEGFRAWLSKQKPQWRHKIRQKLGSQEGYMLHGKFYTAAEANQLGRQNPELIVKFKPTTKRQ